MRAGRRPGSLPRARGSSAVGAGTRYLIAGGSAAGMAAAQAIAETDPGASITVFSAEKVRPYFRPMIPYVISGTKRLDELLLEIMGSGHPLEIDGIGGGNSLSSKVAIVGPATRDGAAPGTAPPTARRTRPSPRSACNGRRWRR